MGRIRDSFFYTVIDLSADTSGATAVEYSLMAALIALGMLAGLGLFGDSVVNLYVYSNSEIVNWVLNGDSGAS